MNRDIVVRLCNLMGKGECDSVREIIGMCQEHFFWIKHPLFLYFRRGYLPMTFRPNSHFDHEFVGIYQKYSLKKDSSHTILLNKYLDKGIYQWTIQIKYSKNSLCSICLGVVVADFCSSAEYEEHFQGKCLGNINGSCALHCGPRVFSLRSPPVTDIDLGVYDPTVRVQNNSRVSAELDTYSRTLTFFVNGRKVPQGFSGLAIPSLLGVSGYANPSFTALLFRRMSVPTPSPVMCTLHRIIPLDIDDCPNLLFDSAPSHTRKYSVQHWNSLQSNKCIACDGTVVRDRGRSAYVCHTCQTRFPF